LLIALILRGEIKGDVQETIFQINQVQEADQAEFNGN